jgi:hypothetical protein
MLQAHLILQERKQNILLTILETITRLYIRLYVIHAYEINYNNFKLDSFSETVEINSNNIDTEDLQENFNFQLRYLNKKDGIKVYRVTSQILILLDIAREPQIASTIERITACRFCCMLHMLPR